MSNDFSRRSGGAKADRDRILEQALKAELRATTGPVTPECLDAETFAAWNDGGLDAAAMQIAESHVSSCARCQSMLGALRRASPGTEDASSAARHTPFSLWKWWLAPIAAGAAAVTLWVVIPEQQDLATAPPNVATPERDAVAQSPATGAVPAEPAPTEVRAERQDALNDRAQAPAALAEREDRRERQAERSATTPDAGKFAAKANETVGGAAAIATAQDAAAPAVPSAPAPATAPPAAALQKSSPALAPAEVTAPDGLRRWRVVATGVEYSTDRGASWIPVRAVGTEVITGGIAPSGSTCWLIGKAGLVLVTVDGMTFAKVDLPVRVDVASIDATDARSATVTTTDGRSFRTNDSGRNWRQN